MAKRSLARAGAWEGGGGASDLHTAGWQPPKHATHTPGGSPGTALHVSAQLGLLCPTPGRREPVGVERRNGTHPTFTPGSARCPLAPRNVPSAQAQPSADAGEGGHECSPGSWSCLPSCTRPFTSLSRSFPLKTVTTVLASGVCKRQNGIMQGKLGQKLQDSKRQKTKNCLIPL